MNETTPAAGSIPIAVADAIAQAAAALGGASDALAWRAAAEGDEMLALISQVIDDQAAALRVLVR
ncbi:MAG: hypothetical protein IJ087_14690 [Eggerthellaceae bacterium]|nr:hypothetical protein [Eggerthellaceae bacterium]